MYESFTFKARYQANGAVSSIEYYDPGFDADTCIAHRWAWPPYATDGIAWTDTIIPRYNSVAVEPEAPEMIGVPAATLVVPAVPPFYTTAFFVIKGKQNVSSVQIQSFDQNGALCETSYEFGWMDTLWIGTLNSKGAFSELIDLGVVTATTNEREIKKRRPLTVMVAGRVDAPFYRRYYLRLGK